MTVDIREGEFFHLTKEEFEARKREQIEALLEWDRKRKEDRERR